MNGVPGNPFANGDAFTIMALINDWTPLAPVTGHADPSTVWRDRSLICLRATAQALVWMRDREHFDLSFSSFVSYLTLQGMEELYIKGYKAAMADKGAWLEDFSGVKSYLESSLPNYSIPRLLRKAGLAIDPGAATEQEVDVLEKYAIFGLGGCRAALLALAKAYGVSLESVHPFLCEEAPITSGSKLFAALPRKNLASAVQVAVMGEALTWGRYYGPNLSGNDWAELKNVMSEFFAARLPEWKPPVLDFLPSKPYREGMSDDAMRDWAPDAWQEIQWLRHRVAVLQADAAEAELIALPQPVSHKPSSPAHVPEFSNPQDIQPACVPV